MVPDLELQLAAATKALREVVAPAIDPANGVALEQLHLAMATVDFVRTRLPLRRRRVVRELENAHALAMQVAAAGGGTLAALADEAQALLDSGADDAAMDALRLRILDAAEQAVAADPGNKDLSRAVLAVAQHQTDLARAWFAPMGFEVDPAGRPTLEQLLEG
ncbi:hypothetical protein [Novosphingobium colocasiae]|uniref:hypothetical protein n=1 Tax=Novosphingobium colocasiae TaxID=1256513 RepID=UPI0035B12D5C